MAVLETNQPIFIQIGDISSTNLFRVLFSKHPSNMSMPKSFCNGVRILFKKNIRFFKKDELK